MAAVAAATAAAPADPHAPRKARTPQWVRAFRASGPSDGNGLTRRHAFGAFGEPKGAFRAPEGGQGGRVRACGGDAGVFGCGQWWVGGSQGCGGLWGGVSGAGTALFVPAGTIRAFGASDQDSHRRHRHAGVEALTSGYCCPT
ncbi:hypothetical protein GCM10020001_031240 [Nonomuraea salmonea]